MCTGSRVARAAALALGALAPGGGGLGAAGAGLKRPLRGVAAWVPLYDVNCLTLAGSLRVDSRRSALLVKGAAHVWVCLRRGTALSLSVSARLGAALGGAGALPASSWCVCTGSRRVRATAMALGTLAPVRGGFGAACAGGHGTMQQGDPAKAFRILRKRVGSNSGISAPRWATLTLRAPARRPRSALLFVTLTCFSVSLLRYTQFTLF